MSKHHKPSKHQQEVKDANESKRFLTIVAISVLALVLLMYLIFRPS